MEVCELQNILNAIEEPVVLISDERYITQLNRSAEEILGVGLQGQPFVRALRHPDAIRCLNIVFENTGKSRANIQLSTPTPTTYQFTAIYLDNVDHATKGQPVVVVTLRDVSPLLEAAQMRSDFVANVSHELRSPLTTLSGMIETLQSSAKKDPKIVRRFLRIMQIEAERMDRLIDDLLSLSRVEAEEKIRPTERVELIRIIKRVCTTVSERNKMLERKILFQPECEECMIMGNSDQLLQVFLNLIENAIKYSKPGGDITISLHRHSSAPQFLHPVWLISVEDQGEGIEAEHIPRLSERFYRIDNGRSRKMGGTGLGLAIVKHILSRHRGRMTIQSIPGSGTKVTVFLPA
ncbi:ATP-binding protein [Candidatus Endowatersipora endosymbiont of Watersipora subatra]|uniref:ATP-binding protein n=1 Tax=Candidatus Endowatersipora endosymbiont of Watersipora subatra TaxID=3077946 RepID=UPI00312CABD4